MKKLSMKKIINSTGVLRSTTEIVCDFGVIESSATTIGEQVIKNTCDISQLENAIGLGSTASLNLANPLLESIDGTAVVQEEANIQVVDYINTNELKTQNLDSFGNYQNGIIFNSVLNQNQITNSIIDNLTSLTSMGILPLSLTSKNYVDLGITNLQNQIDLTNSNLTLKQNIIDNSLITPSKIIPEAINQTYTATSNLAAAVSLLTNNGAVGFPFKNDLSNNLAVPLTVVALNGGTWAVTPSTNPSVINWDPTSSTTTLVLGLGTPLEPIDYNFNFDIDIENTSASLATFTLYIYKQLGTSPDTSTDSLISTIPNDIQPNSRDTFVYNDSIENGNIGDKYYIAVSGIGTIIGHGFTGLIQSRNSGSSGGGLITTDSVANVSTAPGATQTEVNNINLGLLTTARDQIVLLQNKTQHLDNSGNAINIFLTDSTLNNSNISGGTIGQTTIIPTMGTAATSPATKAYVDLINRAPVVLLNQTNNATYTITNISTFRQIQLTIENGNNVATIIFFPATMKAFPYSFKVEYTTNTNGIFTFNSNTSVVLTGDNARPRKIHGIF